MYLHEAAASFYKTASLTIPTLYAIYQDRNSWNPINACVMSNDNADLGTKLISLKLRQFKFFRLSETPAFRTLNQSQFTAWLLCIVIGWTYGKPVLWKNFKLFTTVWFIKL